MLILKNGEIVSAQSQPKVPEGELEPMYAIRPLVGNKGMDKGKAIVKIGFQHEPIVDAILARPRIEHKELAERFGYSAPWMSRLINSDAFQARLGERRQQLTDPALARRLNARLQGLTMQAVETLGRKLDATDSAELALQALGIASSALEKGISK